MTTKVGILLAVFLCTAAATLSPFPPVPPSSRCLDSRIKPAPLSPAVFQSAGERPQTSSFRTPVSGSSPYSAGGLPDPPSR